MKKVDMVKLTNNAKANWDKYRCINQQITLDPIKVYRNVLSNKWSYIWLYN